MSMENNINSGGPLQDNSRPDRASFYLDAARSAADAGDHLLAIHLFLAAFEASLNDAPYPSAQSLEGIERAWGLAVATRQRSLAEHIFEKAEPFWTFEQIEAKAEELQRLAFDKLEEYGVSRDVIEEMAEMVGEEFSFDLPELDVRFDDGSAGATSSLAGLLGFDPDVADEGAEEDIAGLSRRMVGMAQALLEDMTGSSLDATQADVAQAHAAQADVAQAQAPSDANRADGVTFNEAARATVSASRDAAGTVAGDLASASDDAAATASDPASTTADAAVVSSGSAAAASGASAAGNSEASKGGSDDASAAKQGNHGEPANADNAPAGKSVIFHGTLPANLGDLGQALARLGFEQAERNAEEASEGEDAPRGYDGLVGFERAIARMGGLGVGRSNDPAFDDFVKFLNQRHGVSGPPRLGTVLFTGPSREDLRRFMVATVAELKTPAIRMRMDHNALGQSVLVVMASPDFRTRINTLMRNGFESPAVLILEDLDSWDLPDFDSMTEADNPLAAAQVSRGARDALSMIAVALDSPNVDVFMSASQPEAIDPFFLEGVGVYERVDIDMPDREERRRLWRFAQELHPSMRGLDVEQLVECSHGMGRSEIDVVVGEAVDEAYRKSLESNRFTAVHTEDVLIRLSSFQELDSREYLAMERFVLDRFRQSLDNMSTWDELL